MKQTIDLRNVWIHEGGDAYFGADQRWYQNKWHSLSGCGPATAALVTMHMAGAFPERCAPLYPYALPAGRSDFTAHMQRIRPFVKPGLKGLNSAGRFASGTAAYAKSRGVNIVPLVVSRSLTVVNAFGFVQKAIEQNYMSALMILKNPSGALADFHWHWMAVTGCDAQTKAVFVSTYGREYELPFEQV